MERIREHYLASHLDHGTLKFFDKEAAYDFAGERGVVMPIEESFIFENIPEKVLFEEDNKYFFEDAKKLRLSGFLTKRGSELLQKLIAEDGRERVALLLHQPITTQFKMSQRLNNRLHILQIFSLLSVIKIKDANELRKHNRVGPKLAPELIAIVESQRLELGMVIPFDE